jgi:hypothetical protein
MTLYSTWRPNLAFEWRDVQMIRRSMNRRSNGVMYKPLSRSRGVQGVAAMVDAAGIEPATTAV